MNYEEKAAVALLRKSIKRDPEILVAILKDVTKESAYLILKQASRELEALTMLASVMTDAAGALVKLDNKEESK
jgi:hypothetical protein